MNLVLECFTTKFADFSGRARRLEYWLFVLVPATIAFLGGIFTSMNQKFMMRNHAFSSILTILLFGIVIIYFIPALAVAVRRLHDTDRSGWWFLINFIPYIGGIVFLIFMLWPGTKGPNEYGEDPKEPKAPPMRNRPTPPLIRQTVQQEDIKPAAPRKPIEVDYE